MTFEINDSVINAIIPPYNTQKCAKYHESCLHDIFGNTFESANEILKKMRNNAIKLIKINNTDSHVNKLTHRIWITNKNNVFKPNREFMDAMRENYKNLADYEHYIWCNVFSVGAEIVADLNLPKLNIKVKDLGEFKNYHGSKLFNAVMNQKIYACACSIARVQIVHKYGGLYSDIGWVFKPQITNIIKNFNLMINGETHKELAGIISHNVFYAKNTNHILFDTILKLTDDSATTTKFYNKYGYRGVTLLVSPYLIMAAIPSICPNELFLSITNTDYTFSRLHSHSHINGKFGSNTYSNADVKKFCCDMDLK